MGQPGGVVGGVFYVSLCVFVSLGEGSMKQLMGWVGAAAKVLLCFIGWIRVSA